VRLRTEVADRRDAALARDALGRASAARLEALELASAAVAVTGPGVVVVLDDRPSDADPAALPRGGEPGDGRVLDRDLQALVNGLWAAGAEAVAAGTRSRSPTSRYPTGLWRPLSTSRRTRLGTAMTS